MTTQRFEYEPPELWDAIIDDALDALTGLKDSIYQSHPDMFFCDSKKQVIDDLQLSDVQGIPVRVKRIIIEVEVEDE